jgi:outer membrane protein OmpA-like peptidoglycan-associated protein
MAATAMIPTGMARGATLAGPNKMAWRRRKRRKVETRRGSRRAPLPAAATPSSAPNDAQRKDNAGGGSAGQPERGRWSGGQPAAPSEAHDMKDLKSRRKERSEDGGKRVIIEEPDKRRIVREGGRSIIRHDETDRFRRIAPDTRREKRNGLDISVTLLPGGIRIFTDLDREGRPLRRYRRGPDGRDVILFDNRDYYRRSRGGSFLDAIIDLPPPRLSIPRDRYIVDYDSASDEDIYDTLYAGPVEDLDRGYSLEEVRRSPMLRDRMRRIDLDSVNFEFGSWTVDYNQYGTLERVARAMNRIIERNPAEMFLIEGHTDAVGSDDDNLSLSDRRAESVAIILTEEFGVPPENLTTQGYGEQYLKVPTDGPERLNRRVAVRKITPLLAR